MGNWDIGIGRQYANRRGARAQNRSGPVWNHLGAGGAVFRCKTQMKLRESLFQPGQMR